MLLDSWIFRKTSIPSLFSWELVQFLCFSYENLHSLHIVIGLVLLFVGILINVARKFARLFFGTRLATAMRGWKVGLGKRERKNHSKGQN